MDKGSIFQGVISHASVLLGSGTGYDISKYLSTRIVAYLMAKLALIAWEQQTM
jgi:hypothetical protein